MLDPLRYDIPEYHFVDESQLVGKEDLGVLEEKDVGSDLFLSISSLAGGQADPAGAPAPEEEEKDGKGQDGTGQDPPAAEEEEMPEGWDEEKQMVCRSKFEVPRANANFTDTHGVVHPMWAQPYFRQEFKTFDEVFKSTDPSAGPLTSAEIFTKFVEPQAKCQNDCYMTMIKHAQQVDDKRATKYGHCKLECYKMELRRIDPDFVKEYEEKVCHPAEWWGIKKVKKAAKQEGGETENGSEVSSADS